MAAVGPATGLPAQPNFSDHLFCIWGAHWTADKTFYDLGNLLETNCRVQVQCNWTAGCPVKWRKSDTARAERMKQEFISLHRACRVLCSHREFTHRQKHVCLLVIFRGFYSHSLCIRIAPKPYVFCTGGCVHTWTGTWACMGRQFAGTDLRHGKGLLVHWGVSLLMLEMQNLCVFYDCFNKGLCVCLRTTQTQWVSSAAVKNTEDFSFYKAAANFIT